SISAPGGSISLTSTSGTFGLAGSLSTGTTAGTFVDLQAHTSILNGAFVPANLTTDHLILESANGNVGGVTGQNLGIPATDRLNVGTTNLTAISDTGNVWLFNPTATGGINLVGASKAGTDKVFDVLAPGTIASANGSSITVHTSVGGGTISIDSTGAGLNLQGSLSTDAGAGSVSLTSFNDIVGGNFGSVTTDTLILDSTNGSIGSSNGTARLTVSAPNVTATAANAIYLNATADM